MKLITTITPRRDGTVIAAGLDGSRNVFTLNSAGQLIGDVTDQATVNALLATGNFFVYKRAALALDPVDPPDPDPVDPPVTPGSADPDAVDPDPVDPDATTATITPPPTDNADAISATVVVKPPVKAGSRRRG